MTPQREDKTDATAAPEAPPTAPVESYDPNAPSPGDEKVFITHAAIDGAYGQVTRAAFDSVYEAKGWSVIEQSDLDPTWRLPSTPSE